MYSTPFSSSLMSSSSINNWKLRENLKSSNQRLWAKTHKYNKILNNPKKCNKTINDFTFQFISNQFKRKKFKFYPFSLSHYIVFFKIKIIYLFQKHLMIPSLILNQHNLTQTKCKPNILFTSFSIFYLSILPINT